MKYFKKLLCATLAMGGMAWACQAMAVELWDPQLRSINVGMDAGALPPPGVYTVVDQWWGSLHKYDSSGHAVANTGLQVAVTVPIVLWVPGVKILGGDYALGIAQPFDYTSSPGISGTVGPVTGARITPFLFRAKSVGSCLITFS